MAKSERTSRPLQCNLFRWPADSNPDPSCCEIKVLTTAAPLYGRTVSYDCPKACTNIIDRDCHKRSTGFFFMSPHPFHVLFPHLPHISSSLLNELQFFTNHSQGWVQLTNSPRARMCLWLNVCWPHRGSVLEHICAWVGCVSMSGCSWKGRAECDAEGEGTSDAWRKGGTGGDCLTWSVNSNIPFPQPQPIHSNPPLHVSQSIAIMIPFPNIMHFNSN